MSIQPMDITGVRFGKWVANRRLMRGRHTYWSCRCDCGNELEIRLDALRNGTSGSCGCTKRRMPPGAKKFHGRCGMAENRTWNSMIRRCYNPKQKVYKDYGARGIRVCDRWLHSFEAFLADMGPRPSPEHSIDRYPDQTGNYEPTNCRWATKEQQCNNRRSNRLIEHDGVLLSASQWARKIGVQPRTLLRRAARGMPISRILSSNDLRSRRS